MPLIVTVGGTVACGEPVELVEATPPKAGVASELLLLLSNKFWSCDCVTQVPPTQSFCVLTVSALMVVAVGVMASGVTWLIRESLQLSERMVTESASTAAG